MNLAEGYPIGDSPRSTRDIVIDDVHRLKHVYLIGDSGSGKTKALESWLIQDFNACQGFCLIDNQGTIYRRAISHFLHAYVDPKHPIKPQLVNLSKMVVLVEPVSCENHPLSLNVLAPHRGYHPHSVGEQLLYAFRSAWSEFWGPRMEDFLRNALLLLQEHKLTLLELPKVVLDEDYRKRLAKHCENPIIRDFFLKHLDSMPDREWRTWVEAIRNKVTQLISNPYLAPMVSHDSCFDFELAMNVGQWVLVHLPKSHLHESGSLMGKLILSRIFIAALAREEHEQKNWYVYLDEAQDFVTQSVLDFVTQTRKRGLGVVLSHQNLLQPPFDKNPGFLETVISNCHSHVVFRVSHRDAKRLAGELFVPTGDKVKLRKRHWIWGEYGPPRFWSVQEEQEHYMAELENQQPRECYVALRGAPDPRPYVARTYHFDDSWMIAPSLIDEFRAINFRQHGTHIEKIREMARNRDLRVRFPEKAIQDHGHQEEPAEANVVSPAGSETPPEPEDAG